MLRDFSFAVREGQKVALVGPSGCGKSTCIQLLLRFYNLHSGDVVWLTNSRNLFPVLTCIPQILEGENIEGLNVPLVRSSVGVVSQEPVLFRRSIADNIRYGANSRGEVPMEEVVAAAKKANIHDFIESLPEVCHIEIVFCM